MKKNILFSALFFTCSFTGLSVLHAQTAKKVLGHVPAGFEVLLTPARSAYYLENRNPDSIAGVKMTGTVTKVVSKDGIIQLGNSFNEGKQVVTVIVKDQAFAVPGSLEGKQVAVYGTMVKTMQSVGAQKQYLAATGSSKAAIDAVKEPKVVYQLLADGVEEQ